VALEWGLAHLADTVELVVSELSTNAVRASALLKTSEIPVVRLWLASDGTSIVVHVQDESAEMPTRKDAGLDEAHGRGLLIVDHVSDEWGAYRKANGKVVWARLTPGQ
jgi:hypothetical protein